MPESAGHHGQLRIAIFTWQAARGTGRPATCCLSNPVGAGGDDGQTPMSASHWLVVRGVTPSSFWAELSGAIERPGMALIAW